jgi:dipeptidyl-peptidase 4
MNLKKKIFVFAYLMLMTIPAWLMAQQVPVTEANYRLAERFSPAKVGRMVFSTTVNPSWLKTGDKFWYTYKTSDGETFWIVDLEKKTKEELFDNHEMARQLTLITKDPYDHQNLPRITPKFVKDDKFFQFSVTSTQIIEVEEKKKDEDKGRKQRENDKEKEDEKENDKEILKEEEKKENEKEKEELIEKEDLKEKKEDDMEKKEDNESDKKPRRRPTKEDKKVYHLEYNIATGELYEIEEEEKPSPKGWANVSPDSAYVVFAREFNLFWMDKENYLKALEDEKDSTIVEHQLTTTGEPYYAFGPGYVPNVNDDEKKIKEEREKRLRANVIWSPDSRRFALTRNDSRDIKFFWVINSLTSPRPTLQSYKYMMPGETLQAESELWVFDMMTESKDTIPVAAFVNQTLSVPPMIRSHKEALEDHTPAIWLSPSSDELYFVRSSRDLKRIDLCRADLTTGEVSVLIEERMNTYVDFRPPHLLNGGEEIIHWSERDGWGHYYLYDRNGNMKHQITTGPWNAKEIQKVDERNRVMFFEGVGREKGENPYYAHLYRIKLDGSGLQLLNPGEYNHSTSMSDSYKFFINNLSRIDEVPRSEVRDANGRWVMDLESTDMSGLLSAGYQFPEKFTIKAADGITDLYGMMYKPYNFDPNKKYPLILYVYPGPQTEGVPINFHSPSNPRERLAQIGFIVVCFGNRGGHPDRSKWYHNYGYGDLRDYGLADKKYGAEQLADRFSFIDIDKVGIFGHSGGGFMSTAAMLQYPDFFKVAVSSAGNHENNIYNRWWSERHHGVKEIVNNEGEVKFVYDIETNSSLAKNLKGKLLLTTGDIDNNVNPAGTYRMADALIKAQKRFDIFIFTGQRHSYMGEAGEYNFWLTADYFAKHLIGDYSISTDIFEMRRENKMSAGDSRRR